MSSSLEADLESLQLNDYASVAILAGVTYDYFLTISDEVEYIWKRPWSWVSTIYIFVRYVGLAALVSSSISGTTFIPGPLGVSFALDYALSILIGMGVVYTSSDVCKMLFYVELWTYTIFTFATDLVMIFRVYAMYSQSKTILGILSLIYISEIILGVTSSAIYSNPGNTSVFIPSAPDPSVCILEYHSWNWGRYSMIPVVVLQAVMCILVTFQAFRQSFQLYQVAKRWQFNQYCKLLVEQGLLYFFINLFHGIFAEGLFNINFGQTISLTLTAVANIWLYALNPRFILSIRGLHAQSVHGHRRGIDTGFGMTGFDAGTSTNVRTALYFANPGLDARSDELDEIPLETQGTKRCPDGIGY